MNEDLKETVWNEVHAVYGNALKEIDRILGEKYKGNFHFFETPYYGDCELSNEEILCWDYCIKTDGTPVPFIRTDSEMDENSLANKKEKLKTTVSHIDYLRQQLDKNIELRDKLQKEIENGGKN